MKHGDLNAIALKLPLSKATLARNNYENNCEISSAKPEQVVRNESMAAKARESGNPNRVHVSIRSFRRRLLDADNLCPKYFLDCLTYAEIIRDDAPKYIVLEVSQEKVRSKDQERTEIEIL